MHNNILCTSSYYNLSLAYPKTYILYVPKTYPKTYLISQLHAVTRARLSRCASARLCSLKVLRTSSEGCLRYELGVTDWGGAGVRVSVKVSVKVKGQG